MGKLYIKMNFENNTRCYEMLRCFEAVADDFVNFHHQPKLKWNDMAARY